MPIFEIELTLYSLLGGIQLDDAFWEEVNAVCEEHDAQSSSKSQDGMEEEEESLVLSCGDSSLPPVISITADGGEVCELYVFKARFWFYG